MARGQQVRRTSTPPRGDDTQSFVSLLISSDEATVVGDVTAASCGDLGQAGEELPLHRQDHHDDGGGVKVTMVKNNVLVIS
ncbi:hypothetical protein GN958_ATG12632 [Phytophthora infestans]|uniref:Uncharacterized protein n=1 Tax=Phytophthora infestans TaxID=4787 RepID=A0A8S9TPE1_PHYIN|nr:hypothetical protein GN958_ATG22223 [Phytophthora infestans]KAF4138177.1 hypothetical protein GN958_ATG12632 [Phytophthora infestans]